MIECEISSHDAYGTPRELFIAFFGVIAGTLREILGADGRRRSMLHGGNCSTRSSSWSCNAQARTAFDHFASIDLDRDHQR